MPPVKATKRKKASKGAYFTRFNAALSEYGKIIVVCADNVRSKQMHEVRIALRGKAEIIMGKNTLMKTVIRQRFESNSENNARDAELYNDLVKNKLLMGNVGLVLTNDDIAEVVEVLGQFKVRAPARVGAIAQCDVTIPAGVTGLEPTQTAFFNALNIPTKITKGSVEILKDQHILTEGQKVGGSEAQLLAKMKIEPFFYGLETLKIWDNGLVYDREVLALTDENIGEKFCAGLLDPAALLLAAGVSSELVAPTYVNSAFKDIVSLAIACPDLEVDGYGIGEFREALLSGKLAAAAPAAGAAAAGGAAAPAAAAAAAEEDEEEDADFGGMDLF